MTYRERLPGLKFLRTLWSASVAGGPFKYTGEALREAHLDLRIGAGQNRVAGMSFPKIRAVRAYVVRGGGADYHDQGEGHWIDDHIATPMSRYPEYRQSRQSFGINVLGTLVVEIVMLPPLGVCFKALSTRPRSRRRIAGAFACTFAGSLVNSVRIATPCSVKA